MRFLIIFCASLLTVYGASISDHVRTLDTGKKGSMLPNNQGVKENEPLFALMDDSGSSDSEERVNVLYNAIREELEKLMQNSQLGRGAKVPSIFKSVALTDLLWQGVKPLDAVDETLHSSRSPELNVWEKLMKHLSFLPKTKGRSGDPAFEKIDQLLFEVIGKVSEMLQRESDLQHWRGEGQNLMVAMKEEEDKLLKIGALDEELLTIEELEDELLEIGELEEEALKKLVMEEEEEVLTIGALQEEIGELEAELRVIRELKEAELRVIRELKEDELLEIGELKKLVMKKEEELKKLVMKKEKELEDCMRHEKLAKEEVEANREILALEKKLLKKKWVMEEKPRTMRELIRVLKEELEKLLVKKKKAMKTAMKMLAMKMLVMRKEDLEKHYNSNDARCNSYEDKNQNDRRECLKTLREVCSSHCCTG